MHQDVIDVVDIALQKRIVTEFDANLIKVAQMARLDAIQVDSFTNDEYFRNY